MSLFSSRVTLIVVAVLVLLLGTATAVHAAEPVTVELEAEQEVELGDTVTVRIAVKDSKGEPIPGATVLLMTPASFGDTSGEMRLGQITTDAQGLATFTYQTRREGAQTLIARFPGNSSYAPAEASVGLTVQGSAQLYEQEAGVKVPGIGVWILVLLLSIFWSVYLVIMVILSLIVREGEKAPRLLGGSSE